MIEDKGVPRLVQKLVYHYRDMTFEADFFDGSARFFDSMISPSVGLTQRAPTPIQMMEAESNINKIAVREWVEWHD